MAGLDCELWLRIPLEAMANIYNLIHFCQALFRMDIEATVVGESQITSDYKMVMSIRIFYTTLNGQKEYCERNY